MPDLTDIVGQIPDFIWKAILATGIILLVFIGWNIYRVRKSGERWRPGRAVLVCICASMPGIVALFALSGLFKESDLIVVQQYTADYPDQTLIAHQRVRCDNVPYRVNFDDGGLADKFYQILDATYILRPLNHFIGGKPSGMVAVVSVGQTGVDLAHVRAPGLIRSTIIDKDSTEGKRRGLKKSFVLIQPRLPHAELLQVFEVTKSNKTSYLEQFLLQAVHVCGGYTRALKQFEHDGGAVWRFDVDPDQTERAIRDWIGQLRKAYGSHEYIVGTHGLSLLQVGELYVNRQFCQLLKNYSLHDYWQKMEDKGFEMDCKVIFDHHLNRGKSKKPITPTKQFTINLPDV